MRASGPSSAAPWHEVESQCPALTSSIGFLTTSPNAIVAPIHQKAMPVISATDEERDVWMRKFST
jgi:putative SOS response-associated peptidase YedK